MNTTSYTNARANYRFVTSALTLLSAVLLLCTQTLQAGSATWDVNPASGDWVTAANWAPMSVPNGPADRATFGISHTTDVSITAHLTLDGITFDPGASSFTITNNGGFLVTLSGVGITNNSGATQNFVAAATLGFNAIRFTFTNSATAGSGTIFTMNGGATFQGAPGFTYFQDTSTAGSATFINNGPTVANYTFGGGATIFGDGATAANGTFINNGATIIDPITDTQGLTAFNDTSTAANGLFTNNAATISGGYGGITAFNGSATAANGTFINKGAIVGGTGNGDNSGSGMTTFYNTSTAGNGTFINNASVVRGAGGGFTVFNDSSTAGEATLTNKGATVSGAGGGFTYFYDMSGAGNAALIANGGTGGGRGGTILFEDDSTGGTSQVQVFGNGAVDISFHNTSLRKTVGVTVGSIEGDGHVFLGAKSLSVGSNNMSTTFSGKIRDGGQNGGIGGSLTKIGSGTLDLTGLNTYTGNTNIDSGVLKVDGSIRSNTFVNHSATLAGTGTVRGNVTNNFGGTVSPGDGQGTPGTLTVKSYTQMSGSTLLIDIAGVTIGQFSVLDVFGNANINPNGLLDPVLQNGFIPTIGESFTFLKYADLTGAFFIHDRNIEGAMEHWDITYRPRFAVLTVASGSVPVPDLGSTLLLLTLGLLGVWSYQRQLSRKQA